MKKWEIDEYNKIYERRNLMDIVCNNGKFRADVLEFFRKNGVAWPTEGTLYTLREARREYGKMDQGDNIGFLLEEIKNPPVECSHNVLGIIKIEPSFSSKRFSNLQGNEINQEKLTELLRNAKTEVDEKRI